MGFSFLGGGAPSSSDLTAASAGGKAFVSTKGRLLAEAPLGTFAPDAEAGGDGFGGFGALEAATAAAICFGGRMVEVKEGVLSGLAFEGTTTVLIAGGAAERNDSAVTWERRG